MKIVIATTSGFHLRHLARELILAGRDVTFMTYLPSFRIRRDRIPRDHARSYFWRPQPWSAAALFRHLPRLQLAAVESLFDRTDEAFARDLPACDIFIGLSAMAIACAKVARDRYGAKVIIDRGSRHISSQNEILVAGGGRPLSRRYVERELASYRVADYIALPSAHAVESFLDQGFAPNRLFKNAYGVDFGAFSPSPRPSSPPKLLYIGAWSFRKGCDILASMLRARPDLSLTHVGTRGDLDFPEVANFKTLGHKTHADMRELMAGHHLLLLPSREDGFGMVLVEALASGLSVIGSSMTGAPDLAELIDDTRFVKVMRSLSVEALMASIEEALSFLMKQSPAREILTENDRAKLSWASYAGRYDAFLTSIFDKG